MEIVLKEVHVGSCRTVVTLQMGAEAAADEFLAALITSNPHAASSLKTSMATITSVDSYHNERKFKRVADGIYEIKVPGIRLYCFKDQVEGLPAKLIVATNGGTKNKKREQDTDIRRAVRIRERYFQVKPLADTRLRYLKLPT